MGNIGWFILIYFVAGWLIDVLATIGLIIFAAVKDAKREKNKQVESNETENVCLDELTFQIEYFGGGLERKSNKIEWFRKWLIARFAWPVTVPIGFYHLLQSIKEADINE